MTKTWYAWHQLSSTVLRLETLAEMSVDQDTLLHGGFQPMYTHPQKWWQLPSLGHPLASKIQPWIASYISLFCWISSLLRISRACGKYILHASRLIYLLNGQHLSICCIIVAIISYIFCATTIHPRADSYTWLCISNISLLSLLVRNRLWHNGLGPFLWV